MHQHVSIKDYFCVIIFLAFFNSKFSAIDQFLNRRFRGYPVIDLYCTNNFSIIDFLTMTHFYIQYSVIDLYGIDNFSVINFLARSSFRSLTFLKIHANQNIAVYLRGFKNVKIGSLNMVV